MRPSGCVAADAAPIGSGMDRGGGLNKHGRFPSVLAEKGAGNHPVLPFGQSSAVARNSSCNSPGILGNSGLQHTEISGVPRYEARPLGGFFYSGLSPSFGSPPRIWGISFNGAGVAANHQGNLGNAAYRWRNSYTPKFINQHGLAP